MTKTTLCNTCRNPSACADRVRTAALDLGLKIAVDGSLASIPGSIHLHLQRTGEKGTLEYTMDCEGRQAWLSVHDNRNAEWISGAIAELSRCGCLASAP
ncbi:MAG TPA: hypothetical protein VG944_10040 [Fimbriimonas sp.]|nr:hypothetical protein [Fimbriimonas sp.]